MIHEPVPVVVSADAGYLMPLAVTVRSITDNTPGARVLVLEQALTADDRQRLERSWHPAADVRFIRLSESSIGDGSMVPESAASRFARLAIADIAPSDWRRAIYLDVDVIVEHDLADLLTVDLGGAPVGAVEDLWYTRWCRSHPLPCEGVLHFNSGVMVMDLEPWRLESLGARALDQLSKMPEFGLSDQSVLNVVLDGRWRPIRPSWNVMSFMYFELPRLGEHYHAAVRELKIRHFAGPKPWSHDALGEAARYVAPGLPADLDARLFFKYLDRTAWSGWRPT